jgi:hypothetical protein
MVLPAVPLYSGRKKRFFSVFFRFLKKWNCFKAREEIWNRLHCYQTGSAAGKNGEASLFDRVLRDMVLSRRVICGREPKATMAIIDSKSIINADTSEEKGYDAGKKLQG